MWWVDPGVGIFSAASVVERQSALRPGYHRYRRDNAVCQTFPVSITKIAISLINSAPEGLIAIARLTTIAELAIDSA